MIPKKFVKVLLIGLLPFPVAAQQLTPTAYQGNLKINYVRTWDAVKPLTSPDSFHIATSVQKAKMATAYLDGLGRPIQTVVKQGSMISGDTARDLVTPFIYDDMGREAYKYAAFAANTTGGNSYTRDGLFKINPFKQDSTFKKAMFSDESWYYGQTVFEESPLNRVAEVFARGDSWVGTSGQASESNRRSVKIKNWINTTIDSVRIWNVTNVANSFGTYTSPSPYFYPAGQLFKTVTADEHNKQVIEFKDKEGLVILKKVQLTASPDTGTGKGYDGWLCTYYIYDSINRLRCVVQPFGVQLLVANSWSMDYSSGIIMKEQCFRYEYDKRNRMIMKKVPGAGTLYMIYDVRSRLVMTQDSMLRVVHKWLYTVYDGFNRPVTTGLITDNTYYNDPAYHWSNADGSSSWPVLASYTDEQLTKTFYDDYSWRSGEGNPLSPTRSSSYDSYLITPSNTIWPYPQDATTQSSLLKGLVTGTKVKILGTSTYLYSVNFYDSIRRVIQVQSQNISGGTDITITQFSWRGQPVLSVIKHEKSGTGSQTSIVLTKINYDTLGRVTKTEKKISNTKVSNGSMPGSWATLSECEYDALGKLKKKKLGVTPVDSLEYTYNIRGWSLGMNRSYVKDTTSTSHWFGFDLGYDKTSMTVNGTSHSYTAAQYNGNITGMLWRSTGDDMLRKYDFTYDAANRFLSADFNQLNSNSFNKTAKIDFSVYGMSYDANGNIGSMYQKGWKLGGSVTIDSLVYGYVSNSNKLDHVTDKTNDVTSKLGDFKEVNNNTSQDYTYDGNGNLYIDNNKEIEYIDYNHLNLPFEMMITGKGYIYYTYDALGNKLKKQVEDDLTSITTTTLYIGGFVYQNDTLQVVGNEEGRVRVKADSSAIIYDYMIKDHLGNVRMVLTEETRTDNYPAATMETATATTEEIYYSNLPATRENPPAGYPSNTPPGNAKVAKVNGGGNKIGPAIVLKVMAGDKFNVTVNSWWKSTNTPSNTGDPLSDLLTAIGNSAGTVNGGHPSVSAIQGSTELSNSVTSFLNNQSYTSGKPKAYLNWILLDERFNYVSSSSGFEQVGATDTYTTHTRTNEAINKSGYLYIYVSNITDNIDVFFDNLQVTHIRGPLLEENHYYPFGLIQQGISSKSLGFGGFINKKQFNGIESEKSFDINIGESFFRTHDPQIGRWWQIDPRPSQSLSPYSTMNNNPLLYSDPLGDTTFVYSLKGKKLETIPDNMQNQVHFTSGFWHGIRKATSNKSDVNAYANSVRKHSTAFMGSNTLSDMRAITKAAVQAGKEVLFTGTVGSDREIRLNAVKTDKGEYAKMEDVDKILDANFTKEQQSNLFLIGHVHQQTDENQSSIFQYPKQEDPLRYFGRPSDPHGGDSGDYGPYLYRSSTASERGQSPALILTRWGFTVYGTGESPRIYMPEVNDYLTPGMVRPGNDSYYNYKQLK